MNSINGRESENLKQQSYTYEYNIYSFSQPTVLIIFTKPTGNLKHSINSSMEIKHFSLLLHTLFRHFQGAILVRILRKFRFSKAMRKNVVVKEISEFQWMTGRENAMSVPVYFFFYLHYVEMTSSIKVKIGFSTLFLFQIALLFSFYKTKSYHSFWFSAEYQKIVSLNSSPWKLKLVSYVRS